MKKEVLKAWYQQDKKIQQTFFTSLGGTERFAAGIFDFPKHRFVL